MPDGVCSLPPEPPLTDARLCLVFEDHVRAALKDMIYVEISESDSRPRWKAASTLPKHRLLCGRKICITFVAEWNKIISHIHEDTRQCLMLEKKILGHQLPQSKYDYDIFKLSVRMHKCIHFLQRRRLAQNIVDRKWTANVKIIGDTTRLLASVKHSDLSKQIPS